VIEYSTLFERRVVMKTDVWYSVIAYPKDYEWHGVAHAVAILDAMANETPVFSSRDKREALAVSRRMFAEIIETDWNPTKLRIEWVHAPDAARAVQGLQAVIR
jgi:hypothetical protein